MNRKTLRPRRDDDRQPAPEPKPLSEQVKDLMLITGWKEPRRCGRNIPPRPDDARRTHHLLASKCGPSFRDDAIQDAAVAWLEGQRPSTGVNRRRMKERRYQRRYWTGWGAFPGKEPFITPDVPSRHATDGNEKIFASAPGAKKSSATILDEWELWVLDGIYRHNQTQAEISEMTGFSQPTVSRMIAEAIAKLKKADPFIVEFYPDEQVGGDCPHCGAKIDRGVMCSSCHQKRAAGAHYIHGVEQSPRTIRMLLDDLKKK